LAWSLGGFFCLRVIAPARAPLEDSLLGPLLSFRSCTFSFAFGVVAGTSFDDGGTSASTHSCIGSGIHTETCIGSKSTADAATGTGTATITRVSGERESDLQSGVFDFGGEILILTARRTTRNTTKYFMLDQDLVGMAAWAVL
jgi:hypothetical protein